jgi:hypothetical protein
LLTECLSYIWGGLSATPPVVNVTAFSDIYILTLPSFTWLKVFPDRQGNATFKNGHYAASGDMVYGNSQMFIIGGTYPNPGDADICDLAQVAWAQHNLFTGTKGNVGDHPNGTYWALPDPNVTSNVVPNDVYNVVGGDKNGGATLLSPESGFDTPNGLLHSLLTRQPTFVARTATRPVTTASATQVPPSSSGSSPLSTGAIVGIVIGSVAALVLIIFAAWVIRRRVQRQRQDQEQRRPSDVSTLYYGPGNISVSPQMVQGPLSPGPLPPGPSPPGLFVSPPGPSPPAQLDDTSPTAPPAELDAQRSRRGSPTTWKTTKPSRY